MNKSVKPNNIERHDLSQVERNKLKLKMYAYINNPKDTTEQQTV